MKQGQQMTGKQRDRVLQMARDGYSDWAIHRKTGHARSTIIRIRRAAGVASHPKDVGRGYRRPQQGPMPAAWVHPDIQRYRDEKARYEAKKADILRAAREELDRAIGDYKPVIGRKTVQPKGGAIKKRLKPLDARRAA